MSTKGILKAGSKIQTNLTGASNYNLKVGGVSVSSATSSITLGPYDNDQFYELTVNSGAVSVSCYNALINSVTTPVDLANLGSAQSAGVDARRLITDYGGTIAVSDGVRWRLERLYSTWVSKPAASLVPSGTDLRVTDLNNAIFVSDGTNWLPRGVQNIYHRNSIISEPMATLSGVAAGLFAIPWCKIPAGLLIPNSKLTVQAGVRKTTGIASSNCTIYLGSAKNTSDQILCGIVTGSGANMDLLMNSAAKVVSKTAFLSQNWLGEGVTSGSTSNVQLDRVGGNFNADNNMYVSIGISSASASDTFLLTSLRVSIEA
jgi:hypothetical protein